MRKPLGNVSRARHGGRPRGKLAMTKNSHKEMPDAAVLNEQELFWAKTHGRDYIKRNSKFNETLGVEAWRMMLQKADGIESVLECGCNVGRNLHFLEKVLPDAQLSIIEISKTAFDLV